MRAILTALLLTVATQAGAECGRLCDSYWYNSRATTAAVQAKLDAGADVNARTTTGETPLLSAAWGGAPANILQALLDAGADVMARDGAGRTPLHLAGTPANIQALLDAGADAKAKNKLDKTPWDYAQENEKLKGTKGYWALNGSQ